MKKIKWQPIFGVIVAVVLIYIFSFLFNCFISNHFKFSFDLKLLFDAKTFIYSAVLDVVALLIFLSYEYKHFWTKRARSVIKGQTDKIVGNLENSHFQTESELRRNFRSYTLETLPVAEAGIPIQAEEEHGTIKVVLTEPAHTLAIGTTGSGKTTGFVDPTIQILSRSKDKPSMIIADPKGELYARHASTLAKRGYEIKVLDLRNPFNSAKWNPLEIAFDLHEKAKQSNAAEAQILEDKAYDLLNDIALNLSPITSKDDPIWERGAKNFILGALLGMLHDERMTKDKYIFYNLNCLARLPVIKQHKYFRDYTNTQARNLTGQVTKSADKTQASYITTIADKLSIFNDNAICALTSQNEVYFDKMINKPTALFLQIPDEKAGRHPIASLFISQAYKNFVAIANDSQYKKLSRPVYFILDEFGNLPSIPNADHMITVGRSRNIWFVLVVQSYTQLYNVYGHNTADTIRSNCNVQIFIGTNDEKTTSEFSRLCGNYTVDATSVGTDQKAKEISPHISLKERPLIYPSELAQLNNGKDIGNAIISVFGYAPIKTKFTPSFKTSLYRLMPTNQQLLQSRYFDGKSCEFIFCKDFEDLEVKETNKNDIKEQILKLDCLQEDSKVYLFNILDKGMYDRIITTLQAALDYASPQQAECIRKIIDNISKL